MKVEEFTIPENAPTPPYRFDVVIAPPGIGAHVWIDEHPNGTVRLLALVRRDTDGGKKYGRGIMFKAGEYHEGYAKVREQVVALVRETVQNYDDPAWRAERLLDYEVRMSPPMSGGDA